MLERGEHKIGSCMTMQLSADDSIRFDDWGDSNIILTPNDEYILNIFLGKKYLSREEVQHKEVYYRTTHQYMVRAVTPFVMRPHICPRTRIHYSAILGQTVFSGMHLNSSGEVLNSEDCNIHIPSLEWDSKAVRKINKKIRDFKKATLAMLKLTDQFYTPLQLNPSFAIKNTFKHQNYCSSKTEALKRLQQNIAWVIELLETGIAEEQHISDFAGFCCYIAYKPTYAEVVNTFTNLIKQPLYEHYGVYKEKL